ncbi:MAG TPA: DoxX family protein [Opitutaceae bacterium]|nr:DoxX family protein [Opitutaceae bacterium]
MKIRSLLDGFDRGAAALQSPLLLLIRLYWGWSFAQTGWGKFGRIDEVASWFGESLHIPFPKLNAVMAATTELVGGALLLAGLFARPASVALAFTMVVAYGTAHREELAAIFRETDKFIEAAPFTYLAAAVVVLAFGPGRFSLDHLWRRPDAKKPASS